MKNCQICIIKSADKTGSHIVPHFLSKRIDNEPGQKGRDKELGFVITEDSTSSYFGRAVQPEKLKEIYGEVTDELISENKIKGIVDNYFCSDCEKNLGVVENEYSKTLQEDTKTNDSYKSLENPFISFLFWSSIVWRLSVEEGSGFKLREKDEKKLGRILKKYLNSNKAKIIADKKDYDLYDIGYKVIRSPNYSDKNSTWLHWSTNYERPYSLIIDEYLLFFYFKKIHLKGMVLDFYGSDKEKQLAKLNTPFIGEYVYGITDERYKEISDKITMFGVRKRLLTLGKNLDLFHQKLGGKGKEMHPILKNEILKRITNSNVELGKKHTTENHIKIITETIMEFKNT